jgi:hypothetical protein
VQLLGNSLVHHDELLRDFDDPKGTLTDVSERVSDKGVESCLWNGEFYDHTTARRNRNGLVADHMVGRIAISIGIAEDGTDDMEG